MKSILALVLVLFHSITIDAQVCPNDTTPTLVTGDMNLELPLTVPACIRCGYIVGFDLVNPTDVTWERVRSGSTIPLINGTGGVLIDPNTTTLILNNPGDVISVGDELRCYSAQTQTDGHSTGEHIITILEFNFLNPLISPNDSTVNITEGSNLTLSCDDPGNTGSTSYQWFNVTGSELSNRETTPPAVLRFNDIQRTSSGIYICRSSKTNYMVKKSNITVNVQFLPDPVTELMANTITADSIKVQWSYDQYNANPPIIGFNISWVANIPSSVSEVKSVSSDINATVISNLQSNTSYTISIIAINNLGASKLKDLTIRTNETMISTSHQSSTMTSTSTMSSTYSTQSITGSPSPTSMPPTQRTQTTVVVAIVIVLAAVGIAVGVFAVFTVVLLIYRVKHGSKTVNISKVLQ